MAEWEQTEDGHWTKFTDETKTLVIECVRVGNFIGTALQVAGISYNRYQGWRRRGKRDSDAGADTAYAKFYQDLLVAEAQAEVAMVGVWVDATKKDWQAAARFLAVRFPKRFGRAAMSAEEQDALDQNPTPSTPGLTDMLTGISTVLRSGTPEERTRLVGLIGQFMNSTADLENELAAMHDDNE